MAKCAEHNEEFEAHKAQARWLRRRACAERWKANNRTYYLEQKKRLAARPEYLARRRAQHALRMAQAKGDESRSALPRWPTGQLDLSTRESLQETLDDATNQNETGD